MHIKRARIMASAEVVVKRRVQSPSTYCSIMLERAATTPL